jgi:hypothetical protein
VGAWVHAMAWVCSSAPVGDEVYLYYSGFRWGHKYRRSVERQVGLLKVRRDRYVARRAGPQGGMLTTHPLTFVGKSMALNAVAEAGGEVRVQVCDASRKPIRGFEFADCEPITGDALAAPVTWKGKSLDELRDRVAVLQFSIKNASLYALEVNDRRGAL